MQYLLNFFKKNLEISLDGHESFVNCIMIIKDENLIKSVHSFIQKPFDPEDFSLLVRKSLDSN